MKFSERWLRTMCNPPLSSAELCDRLTMSGLEVEEATTGRAAVRERRRGAHRTRRTAPQRRSPARVYRRCRRGRVAVHRLRRTQRGRRHAGAVRARGRRAPGRDGDQARDDARGRIARHAVLGEGTGHRRRRCGPAAAAGRPGAGHIVARCPRARRHADHAEDHAQPRRLPVGGRHRTRRRGRHRRAVDAARRDGRPGHVRRVARRARRGAEGVPAFRRAPDRRHRSARADAALDAGPARAFGICAPFRPSSTSRTT